MDNLFEKIRKIEALIEGAKTEGEREAALLAKQRVKQRVSEQKLLREFKLTTSDNWHRNLLVALCNKHGIKPYRYKRQKYTTVMVKIDEQFLNNVLWKEYIKYSDMLEELLEDVANDLITKIYDVEPQVLHSINKTTSL